MTEEEKAEKEALIASELEKLEKVVDHVDKVRNNCLKLGRLMMKEGEIALGKEIVARGGRHDNSKFFGIEWERLHVDTPKTKLEAAITQHNTSPHNDHHPEAWAGGIEEMSRAAIGEMVCDWLARSTEFATSLREWVEDGAAKRYGYKKGDKVYRTIMEFLDILCDKPFKQK